MPSFLYMYWPCGALFFREPHADCRVLLAFLPRYHKRLTAHVWESQTAVCLNMRIREGGNRGDPGCVVEDTLPQERSMLHQHTYVYVHT